MTQMKNIFFQEYSLGKLQQQQTFAGLNLKNGSKCASGYFYADASS